MDSDAFEDHPMNIPADPNRAKQDRANRFRVVKGGASKRRHVPPPPSVSIVTRSSAYLEPQAREAMIAEGAYFRSAHRGFEPGHEVDDWLASESEIDGALARGDLPTYCG
jgi:hypothetical protein